MTIERFSASVADRQIACHASANLERAIPGYEPPVRDKLANNAANRGTAFHKVMEDLVEQNTPGELEAYMHVLDYIVPLMRSRRFKVLTEAKSNGWWLSQQPGTTADLVLYVGDEIHVIDYKFGKIPVPAQDNSQGKYYSLAFLPLAPKAKGVTFHILQPFAKNFDSVFFSKAELEQFRQETLAADTAIQAGDTTFGPSDKGCQFCPANPHSRAEKGSKMCPAMMQILYPTPTPDIDEMLDGL